MPYFKLNQINELQLYLRSCNDHDGVFETISYDYSEKSVHIHIKNEIWDDSLTIDFFNVQWFLSISDNDWWNTDTIYGFAVEKDLSKLIGLFENLPMPENDGLYCLFEMISGNKICICCTEVYVGPGQGDGLREP